MFARAAIGCLWLAACTAADVAVTPGAARVADGACRASNGGAGSPAAQALQQRLLRSPLFEAASASGLSGCVLENPPDGPLRFEFRFRDGSRLRVTRDERIELFEQRAELALPPAADATALLQRAERAAFGEGGCGIDWQRPEQQAGDTLYRGTACNCQAALRRDASGRLVALALKSAC